MKNYLRESQPTDLPPSNHSLISRETLVENLKRWRQKLGFCSLFAAVPVMLSGGSQDALAGETLVPEAKTSGREAGFLAKRRKGSKRPIFYQMGANRLAYQQARASLFPSLLPGGNDDCPGEAVPNGTYTAAAPYTDSGDTTGANNTVDKLNYYYWYNYYNYYYAAHGPDRVYSFNVHSLGTSPQIQVTTTSPTYRPMIYLLAEAQGCPTGTGNEIWSWLSVHDSRWGSGNTATINIPASSGSRMYQVFVDSSVADDAGAYTIRIQDVVIGPNRPPTANNDSFTAYQNSAWNIPVLDNDTDPDQNLLSVTSVTQGANGSVVNNGSYVTYTPNPGFTGADTFSYTMSDGHGGTSTATVAVTVNPNAPPVANDDVATVHSGSNAIDVFANDSDPDGNPLSLSSVTQGANGSVWFYWLNGRYVPGYSPKIGFSGSDSFTYTITDGRGGFDTATVTLTVIPNRAPDAKDDAITILENSDWTWIYVLGNDTDPDENSLSVSGVTQGSNGSVSNQGSSVQYRPNPGFTGTDTFTYTISDGQGGADTATVSVNVGTNVNLALAANGGVASASSTYSSAFPTAGANNGDRKGLNWGFGGGWADSTANAFPDWLDINFSGTKTIWKIDVFTLQDNYGNPIEPFEGMQFSSYGIRNFEVQYRNGADWVTIPGGNITSNNQVWRTFPLSSPIETNGIRIRVNAALATYSRITEVEAWGISVPAPTPTPTPSPTRFDFDGDGRADVSVFRPEEGNWFLLRSRDGFAGHRWGAAGDEPVAADYDGDGKTDAAIFRGGVWWVLKSTGGHYAVQWGLPADIPVPADYDGDGKADLAIVRNGVWWILRSTDGPFVMQWGLSTDIPVPADYDGDGETDIAIVRDGVWWVRRSTGGHYAVQWGLPADIPVPADYDGDGRADLAIVRDGVWWILRSTDGPFVMQWGLPTDIPVPADYDGDGETDIAIVRDGVWWVRRSTGGHYALQWGQSTDVPIPRPGSIQ